VKHKPHEAGHVTRTISTSLLQEGSDARHNSTRNAFEIWKALPSYADAALTTNTSEGKPYKEILHVFSLELKTSEGRIREITHNSRMQQSRRYRNSEQCWGEGLGNSHSTLPIPGFWIQTIFCELP
jgi:hypothetical protein